MKFYYIDDTFFKDSLFLYQMRERLLILCKKNDVSIIFVSGTEIVGIQFEGFVNICSEESIQVICSPAQFDVQGLRGVLTCTSLMIEQYDMMCTYSGSVVSYDTRTHACERIYLEFFLEYRKDSISKDVVNELEDMLSEVIMKQNKHKNYN